MNFGAIVSPSGMSVHTNAQLVRLTQSGPPGTVTWTASSNQPWLTVAPASGSGSAVLTVGVQFDRVSGIRSGQGDGIDHHHPDRCERPRLAGGGQSRADSAGAVDRAVRLVRHARGRRDRCGRIGRRHGMGAGRHPGDARHALPRRRPGRSRRRRSELQRVGAGLHRRRRVRRRRPTRRGRRVPGRSDVYARRVGLPNADEFPAAHGQWAVQDRRVRLRF